MISVIHLSSRKLKYTEIRMGLFSKIFKSSAPKCPITEDIRVWMENSFLWLMTQFGQHSIINSHTLTPEPSSFPFAFTGTEEDVFNLVKALCPLMNIDPQSIDIEFYADHIIEYNNQPGFQLSSQQEENEGASAGLYAGKKENGKFLIAIEKEQLKDTEKLVATLAHELAHIKILGEGHLKINDEYLTDLVTVFFGIGIFTANSSFRFYSQQEKWGYSKQGYLLQQEWGYALALYAYIKQERTPAWINFLTPNIKSDFLRSELFIYTNEDVVLK